MIHFIGSSPDQGLTAGSAGWMVESVRAASRSLALGPVSVSPFRSGPHGFIRRGCRRVGVGDEAQVASKRHAPRGPCGGNCNTVATTAGVAENQADVFPRRLQGAVAAGLRLMPGFSD